MLFIAEATLPSKDSGLERFATIMTVVVTVLGDAVNKMTYRGGARAEGIDGCVCMDIKRLSSAVIL